MQVQVTTDLPNGHVNGIVDHADVQVDGVHVLPPEPQLFEVDLESINVDLYKGKYLTPNMFLEEIGKIVFNAEVRAYEDRDRLNKAQAMYTAAQVSIQEFDPGFRMECERMADRERKRREQRRAEKARSRQASREGSANGNGSGQENGGPVRRSARNNGQAPELTITDPLLIERRLKRQRSDGVNGDLNGSGEESGDDHGSKRSRVDGVPEHQEERDELDVLGPTSSQARPASVRFAPDIGSLLETPTRVNNINGHLPSSQQPYMTPIPEILSEGRRSLALDGMLNPTTPTLTHAPPLPSLQSVIASDPINMTPNTPVPFSAHEHPGLLPLTDFINTPSLSQDPSIRFQPLHADQIFTTPTLNVLPPPHTPHRSPAAIANLIELPAPPNDTPTANLDALATAAEAAAAPMEVEAPCTPPRTPSPPLPDFHVDEALLSELEVRFIDKTERLNVEELEQLRATSLNCIWRHRQEWDRDACVRELFGITDGFVEEAEMDESD